MIDWRELMPRPSELLNPRNHPQSPQKGSSGRGFEDIEDEKQARKSEGRDRSPLTQWIQGWRALAELTEGITKNDLRFQPVCAALEEADRAFESDNWPAFQAAAGRVLATINSKPKR